jgi:hypothetical protein
VTFREATYYTAICDLCGASADESSDYTAWGDSAWADDAAANRDWWIERGNHICDPCQPRPDFEDAEADDELDPGHGAEGHNCYAEKVTQ